MEKINRLLEIAGGPKLKDIDWGNVSFLGDDNIDRILFLIKKSDKNYISDAGVFLDNSVIADMTCKTEILKSFGDFKEDFFLNREKIYLELKSHKTGIIKPLLPILRGHKMYLKKEIFFLPKGVYVQEKEWRSAIRLSVFSHPNDEVFYLVPLKPFNQEKYPESHDKGYYWRVDKFSPFFLDKDEFIFLKKNIDNTFLDIWFNNATYQYGFYKDDFVKALGFKSSTSKNFKKEIKLLKQNTSEFRCDKIHH